MKYLKSYNESVRSLMKPKSEEDIKKSLNLKGKSPYEKLLIGAKNGLLWLVKQSLEEGEDINIEDYFGRTALYFASYHGHLNVVKYLVENGADINIQDRNGWTALMQAEDNYQYDVVKFLRNHRVTNESIRSLMKPKSREEIDVILDKYKKEQNVKVNVFEEIIGKIITKIDVTENDYDKGISDSLYFTFKDNSEYKMYHMQDCCEVVHIEDINGDLNDLIGEPLLTAEEVAIEHPHAIESGSWTFYKFATIKGYVDIRWYGSSNGCYSERADFRKVRDENNNEIKYNY